MAVDVSKLFEQLNAVMPPEKAAKFQKPLAEALALFAQANTELSASSVDRRALDAFETSENEQVVTLRNRREEIKRLSAENAALIKEAVEQIKQHLDPALSDERKTELRTQRKTAQKTVLSMTETLGTLARTYLDDAEPLAVAAEEFGKAFGKAKRAGGGSGGSSAPKARVESVNAVHPNGQNVTEGTFSKVGLRTKLAPSELAAEYFKAAGEEDWRKITAPVTYTFGEWTITVTPKAQSANGESADAEAPAENATVSPS